MCTSDGGIGGRNRSGASPTMPVKAEPEHEAMAIAMVVSKHLTPELNDIAGKGIADPGSLLEALELAARLAKRVKGKG